MNQHSLSFDRLSKNIKINAAQRETVVHVCILVFLHWGGNRVFASRALVVVSIEGSISDWLQ